MSVKTSEGKIDAIPSRMDLAKRMENQLPDYLAMVKGLGGMFESIDNLFAAEQAQHDKEKANRDKVGLEKNYEEMTRIRHENFMQMVQVTAEYVDFHCGMHEALASHFSETMPIWSQMLDRFVATTTDDKWP